MLGRVRNTDSRSRPDPLGWQWHLNMKRHHFEKLQFSLLGWQWHLNMKRHHLEKLQFSLFRRLGGQLRRPGAYWWKNCAQGRRCYLRCTILPRLNLLKWSVLPLSVGFGSFLCNRRKDTTKFRKLAIFSKSIFDRLMFKMHYSKLLVKIRPSCFLKSWMQCLSKNFSSKAASAAAGWPSGSRNEYFCRPHHLKEAKIDNSDEEA